MSEINQETLQRAAQLIKEADGLIIAAGAGMGIDSGLPDFRGEGGFWRAYPGLRAHGLDFMDIANGARFFDKPDLAWGFYGHRLNLYRSTKPHPGFHILRHWFESKSKGFIYTSNVDGQFQKTGFPSVRVMECHGSIHYLQCASNCQDKVWSADGYIPETDDSHCLLINTPPHCPDCGTIARPNIMMFGDWYFSEERLTLQKLHCQQWRDEMEQPVVIELGAGAAIPSVRNFSSRMKAPIIRINPEAICSDSREIIALPGRALEILQKLAAFV
jgi:NAD-dependent SIR2 family protein deacetylase